MRMTETGDRDAGEEVNEDIPVDVGERGALAMIEGEAGEHRDTLAAGRDMTLLVGEQRAGFRPGNRRIDFRLEARFAAQDPRFARGNRPVDGCRSFGSSRSVRDFGSARDLRSAGRPGRRRVRFAHAAACVGPPGKSVAQTPWRGRRASIRQRRAIARAAASRTRLKLGQSLKSIIINCSPSIIASPPQASRPSVAAAAEALLANSSCTRSDIGPSSTSVVKYSPPLTP